MELRDYIEIGSKKAGSLTALGMYLGHGQGNMSHFKSGRTPLPIEDCVKLADYINADRFDVIAAAKFASAKNEEKRNYWMQFIGQAKTAGIMALALNVTFFVTTPEKAFANNVLEAQTLQSTNYVKLRKAFLKRQRHLHRLLQTLFNDARQLMIHIATVTIPPMLKLRIFKTQAQ